eukprot:1669514-Pyramimonas_sp.AAC.1
MLLPVADLLRDGHLELLPFLGVHLGSGQLDFVLAALVGEEAIGHVRSRNRLGDLLAVLLAE